MNIKRRKFIKRAGTYVSASAVATFIGVPYISASPPTINKSPKQDLDKIKVLLESKKPNIWLFTGDSITHGAKHTHGYRSYPEVFQERIRWEIGRVRDIVFNTGISGNAVTDILNDFEWRIGQFHPSVVSVMIGTNDCARNGMNTVTFKRNVAELISEVRKIGAIPILHTPNVIILEKSPDRKSLPEYIPMLRDLAQEEKVVLVDNYKHWEEQIQRKTKKEVFNNWLNDPLHPNQYGHQEIARMMFKKIGIYDSSAATCGGEYYEGDH